MGPYLNLHLTLGDMARATLHDAVCGGPSVEAGSEDGSEAEGRHIVLEYSSPNTNKPQHLGHIRNNLLGESVRRLWAAEGHKVTAVNLINDRGIHICKSLVAYSKFGNGETPAGAGCKGDHLVGRYYVLFEEKFQEEYTTWLESAAAQELYQEWRAAPEGGGRAIAKLKKKKPKTEAGETVGAGAVDEEAVWREFRSSTKDSFFNGASLLGGDCRRMLHEWEQGQEAHPEVHGLWRKMNGWCLEGFQETYRRLGVSFDQLDFESQTYLRGKEEVEAALQRGVLRVDPASGAVVWDIPEAIHSGEKKGKKRKKESRGVENDAGGGGGGGGGGGATKVLLRADGTSVYMTQVSRQTHP